VRDWREHDISLSHQLTSSTTSGVKALFHYGVVFVGIRTGEINHAAFFLLVWKASRGSSMAGGLGRFLSRVALMRVNIHERRCN